MEIENLILKYRWKCKENSQDIFTNENEQIISVYNDMKKSQIPGWRK